jgi:hypothetical protein
MVNGIYRTNTNSEERAMTDTVYKEVAGQRVEFSNENWEGYVFSDFYPQQAHGQAPGWFVWGRNKVKYGVKENGDGMYTMLCARPAVKARRYKHWNCSVQRGWHTKREAQEIATALNNETA